MCSFDEAHVTGILSSVSSRSVRRISLELKPVRPSLFRVDRGTLGRNSHVMVKVVSRVVLRIGGCFVCWRIEKFRQRHGNRAAPDLIFSSMDLHLRAFRLRSTASRAYISLRIGGGVGGFGGTAAPIGQGVVSGG